ncbi:Clavaminate synthase-like protein [Rhizopus microsporus ATCC 52813]|uniref:Clavaminate synthase-like protein n=1 Tax=Rhizopus microsporus ATCC 52813 TaxID=1340429 RepID=A0A2G4T5N0_RHIZD|nr:Clavaminate synthase-like protein [Rhizopus microsporus ATCC 52813]PHZ16311.1 Clavaminate synthase-like protein [Rhizopus microsporus ATCC 52813]
MHSRILLQPFRQKRAITTRCEQDALHVKWGETDSTYSYLWLRDNCPCPQCLHPSSSQKLHSSADIPLDIQPIDVKIVGEEAEITWNQPLRHGGEDKIHTSRYSLDFLRRYQSSKIAERFRFNHITPQTWNRDEYKLDWISYHDYMNTDHGLSKAVQRLYNKGLVFLKDVPTVDSAVTEVAERIGPVQETFYGRDFDVKNVAKSINIAYTSLYLGFHMDLMYLDSPPGVQLLHSLKNSVTGGSSIFVDSFRAVELLKAKYPEDYQVLKSTPVTFHYLNNGHHMYYKRPTIVDDEEHSGTAWASHVNYAPQFQGPLDDLSPEKTRQFYRAFQRFADFVEDESLRFELTLQPGQLVMFANRRVLHGRTSFDPNSGDRHLKGTYLALDSLKDKLRVLSAKYGFDSSV